MQVEGREAIGAATTWRPRHVPVEGIDQERADRVWAIVRHGRDARLLVHGPGWCRTLGRLAVASAVVAVVLLAVGVPDGPKAALAALAALAVSQLLVDARMDLAARRLRWTYRGTAGCDRRHGSEVTDQRLEAAGGDLLVAARLLSRDRAGHSTAAMAVEAVDEPPVADERRRGALAR